MKKNEIQEIIARYSERLKKFGDDERTLGWTKSKANLRFKILTSEWDFEGKSVLDFGCGFGDLFGFLQKKKVVSEYHGIDINEDLIDVARKKYPSASFSAENLFESAHKRHFDFAISSGVHNYRISDNWSFIKKTFEEFSKLSRIGFAINFLSSTADRRDADLYYSEASEILKLALSYSRRVTLRHDYMPYEFTVFVNFENAVNDRSIFTKYEGEY